MINVIRHNRENVLGMYTDVSTTSPDGVSAE